jgi:hypothetical protein
MQAAVPAASTAARIVNRNRRIGAGKTGPVRGTLTGRAVRVPIRTASCPLR